MTISDSRKQQDQGWGSRTGDKEWGDERAGEAEAQEDEKAAENEASGITEENKEPVDKSVSYSDYLAEQAEKHGDLSAKAVRRPNEGNDSDKKWANAKELKRDEDDLEYIKPKEDKKTGKSEKQRKEKTYIDVDTRFVEPPRSSNSARGGGRGGGRGGRGGRGAGRGGGGGRGRGGGAGQRQPAAGPTVDEVNFPSLGAK